MVKQIKEGLQIDVGDVHWEPASPPAFDLLFGDGTWLGFESHLLMPEAVVPVAAPSLAVKFEGKSRKVILETGPLIHLDDRDGRWFT